MKIYWTIRSGSDLMPVILMAAFNPSVHSMEKFIQPLMVLVFTISQEMLG